MKILRRYKNFKSYKPDDTNVLYCKDSSGRDWYDIQREDALEDFVGKLCTMISNQQIICACEDPSMLFPTDADVYILDASLKDVIVGDYVKINVFEVIKSTWEECTSLENQVKHYKNLIIQKTKEIELSRLSGFGCPNLELELNELKKIHLEKSHELAISMGQNS